MCFLVNLRGVSGLRIKALIEPAVHRLVRESSTVTSVESRPTSGGAGIFTCSRNLRDRLGGPFATSDFQAVRLAMAGEES